MTSCVLAGQAVLFDCDGVLVASDESVHRAWTRWARRYHLDPHHVAAMVHGRRAADSVELLIAAPQRAAALATINGYELDDAVSVGAVDGARDLVAMMPDETWAVVTSGTTALATARLEAARIRRPRVLVTADDVGAGKPAPDGYLAAAAAIGVQPADAIVIEDSASGVSAGRRAGAGSVVGVGHRALDTDADVVVKDLRLLAWADGLVIPRHSRLR